MSAGKGDWIPGTNDKAYSENYPTIDWNAREREAKLRPVRADEVHGEPVPAHELETWLTGAP